MAYTATIDGMVFDLGQAALSVTAQSSAVSFELKDILDYFQEGPAQLKSLYLSFANEGVVNFKGSSVNDIIQPAVQINYYDPYVYMRFNIDSGLGNDLIEISAGQKAGYINGNSGNDTIVGSFLNDTIIGGAGDDAIYDRGGGGIIDGGDGNDYIESYGGGGTITGGNGNDTIILDAYGTSVETASGGNGNDLLRGTGPGAHRFDGDAGNDTLEGGDGDDVLNGGADKDRLVGGAGNDTLDGGISNDLLIGGSGQNTLTGGAGYDIFGIRGGPGQDDILDLNVRMDKIRIDLTIARNFATLDAVTSTYNEGGWGIIEFADGHVVRLAGIDATTMNAGWFQFDFV